MLVLGRGRIADWVPALSWGNPCATGRSAPLSNRHACDVDISVKAPYGGCSLEERGEALSPLGITTLSRARADSGERGNAISS